jgi:amino acid transporter
MGIISDFLSRGGGDSQKLLPGVLADSFASTFPSYGSNNNNNKDDCDFLTSKHQIIEESSTYTTGDEGSLSSSSSTCPSPQNSNSSNSKNKKSASLGILQLATIIFYSVSGGPFGVEESIRAAGPFYTLLGFFLAPLVFSLPECFMTVELSSGGFQSSAAGCAWVEEAFGTTAGFMEGYLQWVSGATDNAIYPVLFLEYALQVFPSDTLESNDMARFTLITGISVALAYLNWLGLDLVGNMSIVVCCVAMSPFVLLIIFGAPKVDPQRWFKVPTDWPSFEVDSNDDDAIQEGGFLPNIVLGGVMVRQLVNNLFWNLNSFDNAGAFSEDIAEPSQIMPKAMGWALVMCVVGYLLPLLVALGNTDAAPSEWVDGYMATVVTETVGPWLGQWMVFAAALSNIGLFQAELSTDAYRLMGMAERGYLPQFLATRSVNGTPTYSLLVGTMVIVVMGVSNLDNLIEMLNFNYAIALLLEYAAFIKLRISKPDVDRPFKVPLGTLGCAIALIPTIAAVLFVIALASYTTICINGAIMAVGIITYTVTRRCRRATSGRTGNNNHDSFKYDGVTLDDV